MDVTVKRAVRRQGVSTLEKKMSKKSETRYLEPAEQSEYGPAVLNS